MSEIIKTCKQCAGVNFEYKISGPHLGQYCTACGTWQRWVPQGPAPIVCMPWGKYKGTPIAQITDTNYIEYMVGQLQAEVEASAFKRQLCQDLQNRLKTLKENI